MSLATVRDLAIIVLAIESFFVGVGLILLLWQVASLTRMLQEEVKPILDSARETVGTVQGTTSLISETVVTPLAQAAGFFAALRAMAKVLRRRR